MAAVTTPEQNRRKNLVTAIAVAIGGICIVTFSIFCRDSFTGGAPGIGTVITRFAVLTITSGLYLVVSLYYSRRNAAFREKLQAAADAPLPEPDKKKGKKKKR